MPVPLLDLEGLAKACVEGDLDGFASAGKLGWTLIESSRDALLQALANTDDHHGVNDDVSAFTLAQAIGLISEAAHNESGIAITKQLRPRLRGKEIAIAFRHAGQIHFGVRYASSLSMTPGHLWPELKPWYKAVERNRGRLERWVEVAEGMVSVALTARVSSQGSTGAELLAAVIAEPDNVGRRLVYADWLSGQGDAQGELIQLCERQRALTEPDAELNGRIGQLEREFGERIAGEIAQLANRYTLERGFVTQIGMSAPRFARYGERLLARHPIECLELHPTDAKAFVWLARAPATRRLRGLSLSRQCRSEPLRFDDLCGSTSFEMLRELRVGRWLTEGEPRDAFAGWIVPKLERMQLYEVDSTARILAGFARNEVVRTCPSSSSSPSASSSRSSSSSCRVFGGCAWTGRSTRAASQSYSCDILGSRPCARWRWTSPRSSARWSTHSRCRPSTRSRRYCSQRKRWIRSWSLGRSSGFHVVGTIQASPSPSIKGLRKNLWAGGWSAPATSGT